MLPQRKFVKGLNASTPLIDQPQGSVPRGSGLVLTKRGGFRTVDGSSIYSTRNGGPVSGQIEDIILRQIYGLTNLYYAVAWDPNASVFKLVQIDTPTWNTVIGPLTAFTANARPRMLQFNNSIIIYGDEQNTPYQWTGFTGIVQVWLANHNFGFGAVITDGTNVQQLIGIEGDGLTGGVVPVWATELGALTVDHHATWINRGLQVPQQLVNHFVNVYPQWSANGTVASGFIIQVGFYTGASLLYWQPSVVWSMGASIIDSSNNVQTVTAVAGDSMSGSGQPLWNTVLAVTTVDNNVTWTNNGPATFYNFSAKQGGATGPGPQPPTFPSAFEDEVTDNGVVWSNAGLTSAASIPPRGARFAIVYAGSLWVLDTYPATTADKADGPTVLRMSDINNPNSWNPINVAFLGKDDGTKGMGLATFTIAESGITPTGSLVAFKDYSTWQIIGIFGSSQFQIIQAQTDLGCIAPDTIQFLPGFGIARMSHLGPAVFDGVRDRIFGEEIRPYLFGGEDDIAPVNPDFIEYAAACQCSNPPMYVMAFAMPDNNPTHGADFRGLSRLFCYDLVLKAWTLIIDLPFKISCIRQIRQQGAGLAVTVIAADITIDGGGNLLGGAVRTMFMGATEWQIDTLNSTPISWDVQTPEVFSKSTAEIIAARGLYVKGKGTPDYIAADVEMDSGQVSSGNMKLLLLANGDWEAWIPFHAIGKTIHADVSGAASTAIEVNAFEWDVEPQPARPSTMI